MSSPHDNGNGGVAVAVEPQAAPRNFFSMLPQHPIGFWFIFWGELAERCSYYGMMSVLARFISEKLEFGEGTSSTWVYLFKAGCYFFPLAGGFLADQYFGKYRLIVAFCIPYILGHFILAAETPLATIIALCLLAMGSGVIKPNISTLMGMTYDQKRPGDEQLRTTAFGMFYMAINMGAAVSFSVIPEIRTRWGYNWAFMFPAFLMALSFVIFALGKPFYATEVISRREKTPEEKRLRLLTVRRVAGIFILCTFFWAIFDQSHATWVFFANTYMDRHLFGYNFEPEQFGTLNPLLIIVLVPLFSTLWSYLERYGIRVRATDKIVLGFFLTALCMGVMAYAGYMAGPGEMQTVTVDGKEAQQLVVADANKVTLWWQVFAFVIITAAEVLISVTGLELAFVVSPKSMKSFITALWLLTVGLANLFINASVGRLYATMTPGDYFGMLTAAMAVVGVVSIFVAQRFNRMAAEMPPMD